MSRGPTHGDNKYKYLSVPRAKTLKNLKFTSPMFQIRSCGRRGQHVGFMIRVREHRYLNALHIENVLASMGCISQHLWESGGVKVYTVAPCDHP